MLIKFVYILEVVSMIYMYQVAQKVNSVSNKMFNVSTVSCKHGIQVFASCKNVEFIEPDIRPQTVRISVPLIMIFGSASTKFCLVEAPKCAMTPKW